MSLFVFTIFSFSAKRMNIRSQSYKYYATQQTLLAKNICVSLFMWKRSSNFAPDLRFFTLSQ